MTSAVHAVVVSAGIGVLLAAAGCSEESNREDAYRPPVQEVVPPPDPSQEAETALRRLYANLTNHSYRSAWGYLGPAMRAETGGFASWRAGYATTVGTKLRGLQLVEEARDKVVFTGDLTANDLDACDDSIFQRFEGTWVLERQGYGRWVATDIDMEKIAGGTPIFDSAECPSSAPNYSGDVYVPGPGDSYEYDRPYPDLDCEDVGSDIVVGPDDPDNLDSDGDGIGCESS